MEPTLSAEAIAAIQSAAIQADATIRAAEMAVKAARWQSALTFVAGLLALLGGCAVIYAAKIQTQPERERQSARKATYRQRMLAVATEFNHQIADNHFLTKFIVEKLSSSEEFRKFNWRPENIPTINIPPELDARFWEDHSLLGEKFVECVLRCVNQITAYNVWLQKHVGRDVWEQIADDLPTRELFGEMAENHKLPRTMKMRLEWQHERLSDCHAAVKTILEVLSSQKDF